jgi:phospholipase/lecithinase/hemolysin
VPLFDFAWSGATTGVGNGGDDGTPTTIGTFGLPGMAMEFAGSKAGVAPMASTSLFVIWGGPNDFLAPAPEDGGDPLKTADRAVADLMSIVADAQGLGAKHILVPGMPDLGLTPFFQSIGQGAAGTVLTNQFNNELAAALALAGATYFDTASLLRDIVMNPAKYGFTNVTDACINGSTVCANPNRYLFFDDFHPSAQANVILADKFAAALAPEPATWVLVASGFAFAAFMRARGGRRRS